LIQPGGAIWRPLCATIVPAAFMLILQQTLLMGAATLGGVAFEQGGRGARRRLEFRSSAGTPRGSTGFRACAGQASGAVAATRN